ncbi:MAG: glycosyltransferase family 2 protein [Candidatus Wildermuthbacteria bacterium]|nr:glycosyltransferase family 2 protein [Candidatus Wildermuthbacteria bacterium]
MRSSLIILTRNEIEGTTALFNRIPFGQFDEVFVVDYKSSDGTVEYFKDRGVRVIAQEKKGRGEAFRLAAETANSDILIFFSPDGNENPADAIRLKEAVEQDCDMAIASRFMQGALSEDTGSFIPYRDWANKFFTFLADLFFKGKLTDSINGFRAMRKEKFKELRVDAEGFAIEYQMSIRALKLKQIIREIPTQERKRLGGQSTSSSIPTGLKLFKILLREIWLGKNF